MRRVIAITLLLVVTVFTGPFATFAFETDQYNLPPVPLVDIGDEISEYIESALSASVEKVNADIEKRAACVESKSRIRGCGSVADETAKLVSLRSNDAVAREMSNRLAGNDIMFTKFGKWIDSHKFHAEPARYKTSFGRSIFIAVPIDYLTISPTVKLYGTEFGIDKLEHFFQQGYQYYKLRKTSIEAGLQPADAVSKAVKWGQRTERTYYGLLMSGVYSNADLYANYAGMNFYVGLTAPVHVGDKLRPATLALSDGVWKISDKKLREDLIKPFVSEHLNEALNPSGFAWNLYGAVRLNVRKYACPQWRSTYPMLTAASLNDRAKSLERWNGEDYGQADKGTKVTVADTCFAK